jgi:hypothetical protein
VSTAVLFARDNDLRIVPKVKSHLASFAAVDGAINAG